jgi:hypothetical protein
MHCRLLSTATDRLEHDLIDAFSNSPANAGISEEALQSERRNGEHIRDLGGAIIGRTVVESSIHWATLTVFSRFVLPITHPVKDLFKGL